MYIYQGREWDMYLMCVILHSSRQETGLLPTVATQGKKEMYVKTIQLTIYSKLLFLVHRVDRAYQRVQDGVVLPALVPRLPTNLVAERQRRSQALRGGGLRIVGRERSSL